MRRTALGAIAAVCAYLTLAMAAHAASPVTEVESTFEALGFDVVRATGSPLLSIAAANSDGQIVVLIHSGPLSGFERAALQNHLAAGGEVWVVLAGGSSPFVWTDADHSARALPGAIYAADGTAPSIAVGGRAAGRVANLYALDAGPAFAPLITTPRATFRDTNGDGALTLGEPSGPFAVALVAQSGEGRLVLLASSEPDVLLATAVAETLGGGTRRAAVIISDARTPGPWAAPALGVIRIMSAPSSSLLAAVVASLGMVGVLAQLFLRPPVRVAARADHIGAMIESYRRRLRVRAERNGANKVSPTTTDGVQTE